MAAMRHEDLPLALSENLHPLTQPEIQDFNALSDS
jgi:hypothetical protein